MSNNARMIQKGISSVVPWSGCEKDFLKYIKQENNKTGHTTK